MRQRLVWLAVLAGALVACGSEGGQHADVEPIPLDLAQKGYEQKCALCHGNDGKLGRTGAPDLTTSKMNQAERERIIRYGKGLMPPQKDVLTDAEIAGIAAYLDTFLAAE